MLHFTKESVNIAQKGRVLFKRGGGGGGCQFSRPLAAGVCASAIVMVVMLDTPCSEVQCRTAGYPLHSHVFPSLPLPCVTVCHQVSTELYHKTACTSLHEDERLDVRNTSKTL